MTTIFNFYALQNDESNSDALKTATSFHAANSRQARAAGVMRFLEEYTDADDQDFQFFVCEDQPGIPRGELDVWDESLFTDNDWDHEAGHLVARSAPESVDFEKLSATMKIAVLVKYMTTEITKGQLPDALELLQDEANTFPGHIVEAIGKMPAIVAMYPERIIEAITFIVEKCPSTKKWPEIKAQLANWLKEHAKEPKEAAGDAAHEEVVTTATTTAYSGRAYEHNFRTLNKEIAYALWSGDVDPAKTDPSISRWADGIIKDEREDWKRWSASIVTRENILSFDRPTIFGLVRNAPKPDLYKFPGELNAYVTDYLANHGVIEGGKDEKTEQEQQNEPGKLADAQAASGPVGTQHPDNEPEETPEEVVTERQGPFYYRTAAGDKIGRANKMPKLEEILAQGCVEISQEEYQARKTGTYQATQNVTEKSAGQPEVKKIAEGVFSVDNLMAEQPNDAATEEPPTPSNEVEKVEVPEAQPAEPSFQSIGAALENDLAGKGDNMKIWRSVMRTDPRYTKDLSGAGFSGTSINAEYMIMRATEIFGPVGTGWGYEILEDRMLPGAPMSEAIYEDKKFIGKKLIRDADGSLITELNHSLKIEFWYLNNSGQKGRFEEYGATPYMYMTSGNKIFCDSEVLKKSLTDAIKKSLSFLGFSADVWLGLYDQAEYKQENAIEFDIRNASDKAEDITRIRKELDEKFKMNTDTMRSAVTPNEVSGIASSLTRVMGVHLKAAREKADLEYAKYLEGRLRRLEEVKTECLAKLQEKAA